MGGKFGFLALTALSAITMSVPASAQTYDAFSSFNAVQGTGGFSYGSYDQGTFSPFTQNSDCNISGVTCLRGSGVDLPSVFKATGSQQTSGTVNLPLDRLIGHPGEFANSLYIAFTAPVAGSYAYTATFNQQDSNTAQNSVKVKGFISKSGILELYDVATIDASQSSIQTGYTDSLAAGDFLGYIIDNNGSYFNDSTGFNFTLTAAVPEPATWAMMIVGFGFAGGALRRRRAVAKAAIA